MSSFTIRIEPTSELVHLVKELQKDLERTAALNYPSSLRVKRLTTTAILPKRGSAQAVGYDLHADLKGPGLTGIIGVGERAVVSTGIAVAIPEGFYGRVAPRSGLAAKQGIDVLAGVVDPDYRGEVKVILINLGNRPFVIEHGDRIAQLILERCATPEVEEVEELNETERGEKGFGSTGVSAEPVQA